VRRDAITPLGASANGRRPGSGRLENLTLWERVHDHLRQEILANRLPPGTVLQEVALSDSLGVSRGPVREAIGRLAAEGLVVVRPRRGAVVASLSKEEFLEAYQVREALEMLAVRLAVPRLDEAGRARLERLVERMARCAARDDVGGFFEANGEFHWSIVEASGNSRLKDTYRQLIEQMGRYRTRSLKLRGSLKRSIAEHRTILRAIRAGDADRAAHLVSEHIRVPQRRLESTPEEELIELGVPAVSP
jgi:GntR family transcriptional regulator, rspAB operon transcriptional repressor